MKRLAILGLLALAGCMSPAVVHDYCYIYDTIQASDDDTKETLQQVDKENGKWLCICRDDCPRTPDPGFTLPVPPAE
jgi:hypothetical protein